MEHDDLDKELDFSNAKTVDDFPEEVKAFRARLKASMKANAEAFPLLIAPEISGRLLSKASENGKDLTLFANEILEEYLATH